MKKIISIILVLFIAVFGCFGASAETLPDDWVRLEDAPDFIYYVTSSGEQYAMLNGSVPSVEATLFTCSKEEFMGYPYNKLKAQFGSDLSILKDKFYIITAKFFKNFYMLELLTCDKYSVSDVNFTIDISGDNAEKYLYFSNEREWYLSTEEEDENPTTIAAIDCFYKFDLFVGETKYTSYHLNTHDNVILYSNFYSSSSNPNGEFSLHRFSNKCYGIFPLSGHNSFDSSGFGSVSSDTFDAVWDLESPWHWEVEPDSILYPLSFALNKLLDFVFQLLTFINLLSAQFSFFVGKVFSGEIGFGEAVKTFLQGLFDFLLSGFLKGIETLASEFLLIAYGYNTVDALWVGLFEKLHEFLEYWFVPQDFSLDGFFDDVKTLVADKIPIINQLSGVFKSYTSGGSALSIKSSYMGHEFVIDDSIFSEMRLFVRNGIKALFGVCTVLVTGKMISSAFGVSLGGILGNSSNNDSGTFHFKDGSVTYRD